MHFVPSEKITSNAGVVLFSSSEHSRSSHSKRFNERGSRNNKKVGNRLLIVGRLRELALYRAEVLRQAGFMVLTAAEAQEAIRIMKRGGFDAVILSYTLPSETVEYLADAARDYCPNCPVVAIAETRMLDRRIEPDAVALAEEGPTALLSALRRVLHHQ